MRALEARKPGFKFVMPLNGTHSQCISTGHGYLHTQLATFQPKLQTYLHGKSVGLSQNSSNTGR